MGKQYTRLGCHPSDGCPIVLMTLCRVKLEPLINDCMSQRLVQRQIVIARIDVQHRMAEIWECHGLVDVCKHDHAHAARLQGGHPQENLCSQTFEAVHWLSRQKHSQQ